LEHDKIQTYNTNITMSVMSYLHIVIIDDPAARDRGIDRPVLNPGDDPLIFKLNCVQNYSVTFSLCTHVQCLHIWPSVRVRNEPRNVTGKAILSTENTARVLLDRESAPYPTGNLTVLIDLLADGQSLADHSPGITHHFGPFGFANPFPIMPYSHEPPGAPLTVIA